MNRIKDLLKGLSAGQPQSVGFLTIIPLLSEQEDDRFESPLSMKYSTETYGTMLMENNTSKMGIVPFGTTVMTPKAAQNHATTFTKIINANKHVKDDTAACIQQTQGGFISKTDKAEISLLPWYLRESAQSNRSIKAYNKLWDAISTYNNSLGINGRGHLELYLERFKKELDEFAFEFEIVKNQVGLIAMIDGAIVGIERCPNYKFFKDLWEPYIKNVYGSLVLQLHKRFEKDPPLPNLRVPVEASRKRSISGIKDSLRAAQIEEAEKAREVVRKFVDEEYTVEPEKGSKSLPGSISVNAVANTGYLGQVVRDGEAVVYATIFLKAAVFNNRKWRTAKEFSI